MEPKTCEACETLLDPAPGETVWSICTRDGRTLCFYCVAEAVMETAIQQQSDKRYFRRRAEIEEERRASDQVDMEAYRQLQEAALKPETIQYP